jgi:TPP-dependent pyruvate/acetoin dehydrogenase alpha subunit
MPDLIRLYRGMQLIRQTEEQLARFHQRGLIHGACHTYVGQEAIAVGVCSHLRTGDVIFSTHRGHGHAVRTRDRLFAWTRRKHAPICTGDRTDGHQRHRWSLHSSGGRSGL